jgi:peptide/nickel transport system permease protein
MSATSIRPRRAGPARWSWWRSARADASTRWGAEAVIGLGIVVAVCLIALVGPLFAPYGPAQIVGVSFAHPSSHFIFGTDYLGRDVLSRFLWGGRTLIVAAVLSTMATIALGAAMGLTAAYKRNWLDGFVMRIGDVIMAFPSIIVAIVLVTAVGPHLWLVGLSYAIASAPRVARVARGAALTCVKQGYVEAAEARGERMWAVLLREVLPNVRTPILIDGGIRLAGAVIYLSTLNFLGLGVQEPVADWGLMISENRLGWTTQPWTMIPPLVAIAALTVGVNLIVDGVPGARVVARRGRLWRA